MSGWYAAPYVLNRDGQYLANPLSGYTQCYWGPTDPPTGPSDIKGVLRLWKNDGFIDATSKLSFYDPPQNS